MRHFFVAGFDFGTSYSKVVLRDQLTGVAKAVTFGNRGSGLFPSYVNVGSGFVAGPECNEGELLLSYPKLIATDAASNHQHFSSLYGDCLPQVNRLLGTHTLKEIAPLILARYFLSVLNAIHQFIARDADWRLFNPAKDPLVVQIAVPIGLNATDNACDTMMQRALAAATLIRAEAKHSNSSSSITDLRESFQRLDHMDSASRENLNARCITYPEVAAGVQTVLRSPNTPDGKYITMDVGAGTVDLNAFLRRSRTEHENSTGLDYWACEVRPLGFARLKLPEATAQRQKHELSVNPLAESDLLHQLQVAIRSLMQSAFRYQPQRLFGSAPADNPWQRQTFAYIWGGGSGHLAYEETFLRHLRSLRIGINDVNRLPAPSDQFVAPFDVDFGRLAIAYGLSFHKANLESVRLPSELKTFNELYPAYWQDVINGENLCTCRGNPACLRCFGSGLIKPDSSIAPTVAPTVTTLRTTGAPRKSRFQIALEKCVSRYNALDKHRPFLIERFLLLDRIRRLLNRPEIERTSLASQQAGGILLYNMEKFGGRVRVLKLSAKPRDGGCQCVVHGKDSFADVVINGFPQQIERVVNREDRYRSVDLICGIRRTERGEFVLEFKDLAEVRQQRRPHPNPQNSF